MYIKEYQIGSKLYEDFVGSTHLANTTDLEKAVYFKILHARYAADAEIVHAFHEGAEKLCKLSQSDLMPALEHGEDGDSHFIIFECFKLSPLEQTFQKKNLLHIVDAVNLIDKIANNLLTYHDRGLAHGALTPQSIFVDDRFQLVGFTSFGFDALVRRLLKKSDPVLEACIHYFSPELTAGRPTDRRSDMYSLGVLFYRIVTGSLPWPGLSYHDFIQQAHKISAIPPSLQRLEIPELIDGLILEMLEVHPDKRCQNLNQFLEVFGRVKAAILASITPVSPPHITPNSTPQRRAAAMQTQTTAGNTDSAAPSPGLKTNLAASGNGLTGLKRQFDDEVEVAIVDGAPLSEDFEKAEASGNKLSSHKPEMYASDSLAETMLMASAPVPVAQNNKAPMSAAQTPSAHKAQPAIEVMPPKPNSAAKQSLQPIPVKKAGTPGIHQNSAPTAKPTTSPAAIPLNDDFGEFSATETEEIATTRTLNINLAWSNNRTAALLLKFFVIPVCALLVLYVSLSFFNFEWARNLPNFRNSLLFAKIQGITKADDQAKQAAANGHVQSQPAAQNEAATSKSKQAPAVSPVAESSLDAEKLAEQIDTMLDDPNEEMPVSKPAEKKPAANLVTLRMAVHSARQPVAADLFLDGKRLGRTNRQGQITISNLLTGHSYSLKVTNSGFSEWQKEISFQNGGVANLDVDLSLTSSQLINQVARDTQRGTVAVLLSNALILNNAFVLVNGELWDGPESMAPAKLTLPAGRYLIEVRKEGFRTEPRAQTVDITAGENETISFRMIPN
jgi:serine/threonine protein kinase